MRFTTLKLDSLGDLLTEELRDLYSAETQLLDALPKMEEASLFREALHEVYLPRIQRGDAFFAAKVLGARGALLSVLARFFERGRWGLPIEMGVEEQSLTPEDQLHILMQSGLYLTDTRGFAAPEARSCYERAEALCCSLDRPLVLFSALRGLWRYSLVTDRLSATMQIAKRVYSLAQNQNHSALMIGAYRALGVTLYYLGDFESARPMAEGISLAKELNDMHALAVALWHAGILGHFERNPATVETLRIGFD